MTAGFDVVVDAVSAGGVVVDEVVGVASRVDAVAVSAPVVDVDVLVTPGVESMRVDAVSVVSGVVTVEAKGSPGADGHDGFDGQDGRDGTNGQDGADGASAYQVAVGAGFVGSVEAWLASLHGADGADGSDGVDGISGTDGSDGKSAYQLAVDTGFAGSESDWLASLKGEPGDDGAPGTPPFVWLLPRQNADYGNGLDGRLPAVSCPATGLTGGYCLGWSPWASVDVYLAWMEGAASTSDTIVMSVYVGSIANNTRPMLANIAAKTLVAGSGNAFRYRETLIASGVAVTAGGPCGGSFARYGDEVTDTYAPSIGVIGLILRPHT